ncbi:MAG: hypothetical protein AAGN46_10185 [Acidobacteriota bacterium]
MRPRLASTFVSGLLTGALLAFVPTAASLAVDPPDEITNQNRRHSNPGTTDNMGGGWGPHLRSVLRASDDSLWFVHDQGPTTARNSSLRYRQRLGGQWIEVGSTNLDALGGQVQQNMAHVMVGHYIYSYGVDIARQRMVECWLNTIVPSHQSCHDVRISGQPYTTPVGSNYVGAAVSPNGYRLVWWTSSGSPASFHHMWNFGSGWNGPVTSPVVIQGNHYHYAAYARAIFTGANTVDLLAQVGVGQTFAVAAHARLTIGGSPPQATFSWIGHQDQAKSPHDIWEDADGGLHALAVSSIPSAGITYFYKPTTGGWSPIKFFAGMTQARFQHDSYTDTLHLLGNEGPTLLLRSQAMAGHSGQLVFDDFDETTLSVPAGVNAANLGGMYNMSRSYQTNDVKGLHFGVVGDHPAHDHRIFHYGD